MSNPLKQLSEAGQAVWLDFVDRTFMNKGGLAKLVEEDGLTGVTSNPSIFEKAIGHSDAYDEQLERDIAEEDVSVETAYEALAIADIKTACATLRPVYDRLGAKDGYVSIEVSPYLALETDTTIAAARRLWAEVNEPNLMVKIPGTAPGVPAIQEALDAGININVTLLFAIDAYKAVLEAYISALEARVTRGEPVDRIASVASFFVSRIDAVIDKQVDERVASGDAEAEALKALKGKVAIANAKLAYQHYIEVSSSQRWQALAAKGAMPQRLLWASTGTKNPAYPDTLYVDTLIGRDTVNTMPPKTMDAFRDHGTVANTLVADVEEARHVLAEVERLGLSLDDVTSALVEDGVRSFADAADSLYGAVAAKRTQFLGDKLAGMHEDLGAALQGEVEKTIERARAGGWSRRLWAKDASLWTGADEGKWLAWLAAARGEQGDRAQLAALAERARGFRNVVLLGMGGSSLGPEVIGLILGSGPGAPTLHALDSTDPGQVRTVAEATDPASTLYIVSSKSGSTMEPELLRAYFWARAEAVLGAETGSHFVAVTDPGSKLEKAAQEKGFSAIFAGDPGIGGRYSVLSVFGLVPAAATGVDIAHLFETIKPMTFSCGPDAPPADNPGVRLGAIIGTAAAQGRDKLTIIPSPKLRPFGAWLEQLLAESTGKQGKGIVPVDLEPLGTPDQYGDDRLFVHLHLEGDSSADHAALDALKAAGQPVVTITLHSPEQIGQEFVRWEVATAIAGAVIGINPFDQPDVEDAKVKTRELVNAYEQTGALTPESPFFEEGPLAFYAPSGKSGSGDGAAILKAFFDEAGPGDYIGVLAYLERNAAHEQAIEAIRVKLRDAHKVATVAGFGPRFLHSTGQAYKGGPVSGLFLEITRTPAEDVAIPGNKASFGTVQLAQARGDLDVLAERGQRVLRVHLTDEAAGLPALLAALGA
ncbi:bifunctional transaldolase/phosoglucose isomerase [Sphingomonas morindae]|uniref:Transaldolase n=1 Tax=Sphingomonas morindae TaxID=1541170 RepID=A0ABY4X678_9SPHN|nr:bifunctional transaldolase/phosoglucose isomerase [Sphingomonas morindae]USI72419.1 bifunctional transaldolase/phosoglucose isomerase [Sphingomonas morindae]